MIVSCVAPELNVWTCFIFSKCSITIISAFSGTQAEDTLTGIPHGFEGEVAHSRGTEDSDFIILDIINIFAGLVKVSGRCQRKEKK